MIHDTPNLRALIITPKDVATAEDRRAWLNRQSETIKKVTHISENGETLYQSPSISPEAYVDPTAQLIGGMIISKGCYIGPFAIVRLDEKPSFEPLIVGEDSNIQDGAVVHSTTQSIGQRVIIAHQSIVHGAKIGNDVTIYIQAVVDGNGTVVEDNCFIHQGAYVGKGINLASGMHVPPGMTITTQAVADRLHPVPPELLAVRDHVLEHNRGHVDLHRQSIKLSIQKI